MAGARETKQRVLAGLAEPDWERLLPELADLGQQAVSPLFSRLVDRKSVV